MCEYYVEEMGIMPRVDIYLMDLIDDVISAKRTLTLQKTFNQISKK